MQAFALADSIPRVCALRASHMAAFCEDGTDILKDTQPRSAHPCSFSETRTRCEAFLPISADLVEQNSFLSHRALPSIPTKQRRDILEKIAQSCGRHQHIEPESCRRIGLISSRYLPIKCAESIESETQPYTTTSTRREEFCCFLERDAPTDTTSGGGCTTGVTYFSSQDIDVLGGNIPGRAPENSSRL